MTETEMTELDRFIKKIVGKTLTNIYFTKQDGPHDFRPGISPAYYFSSIMELDNDYKLRFGNDFIVDWKNEETIITLSNENWNLPKNLVFKGQKITDITKDEYRQLTIHLENGTTIVHTIEYGDQLFIRNTNILNKEQKADIQIAVANSSLLKAMRSWWHKLFGKNNNLSKHDSLLL